MLNGVTFDAMHAALDDAMLDNVALESGWHSGIGRLSFTDDRVLHYFIELLLQRGVKTLLDLGCGRGFLGRWLHARAVSIKYCGVDFSIEAIRAARSLVPGGRFTIADHRAFRGVRYDGVAIFDSLFEAEIAPARAAQLCRLVCDGGTLFIGATLLNERQRDALIRSAAVLRECGLSAEVTDWTELVRDAAALAAKAWRDANWPPALQELFAGEARAVADAVRSGAFRYFTIDGRR